MSAVTIGAAVAYERLRGETVVTIEACEQAVQAVYELWERQCMFCPDADDLDTAAEILDLARHAITGPGRRIDKTTEALFSVAAGRLLRDWETRKRSRLDPTPTSVRVHESNAEFARPMLRALPNAAIDRRTEAGLS